MEKRDDAFQIRTALRRGWSQTIQNGMLNWVLFAWLLCCQRSFLRYFQCEPGSNWAFHDSVIQPIQCFYSWQAGNKIILYDDYNTAQLALMDEWWRRIPLVFTKLAWGLWSWCRWSRGNSGAWVIMCGCLWMFCGSFKPILLNQLHFWCHRMKCSESMRGCWTYSNPCFCEVRLWCFRRILSVLWNWTPVMAVLSNKRQGAESSDFPRVDRWSGIFR